MSAAALVGWLAAVLVAVAAVPALYVLGRAALARVVARRALARLHEAWALVEAVGTGEGAAAAAVERLRRGFDPLTIERVLVALLREGDDAQRRWAVAAFERVGLMARYVRRVREAPAWSERAQAAEVLGLLGVPSAVTALVAALRDPYEDLSSVKAAAADALARIRSTEAIPLLVSELREIDRWSSPRVAEALAGFGPDAVPALVELLGDEAHPDGAVWAARVLGRIGDAAATAPLLERLHDRQDVVRVAVSEALGAIGDRRAAQALIRAALRDPVPQVRAHAAGAIGALGDEGAVDVLVAALGDPDYATRIRALEALEMLRPRDSSALERALRDESPQVRRRAALALERVGYLEARVTELASDDRAVARRAYGAVLELGRAGLVDGVAGYLHHPLFQVRAYVAQACGELGAERAGPLLVAAVDDPAWPVRARLAEALGRLRPEGGAAALARLLADPEPVVRDAAAEALTQLPPEAVAPHFAELMAALRRGSIAVRIAVVDIAARAQGEATEPLLLDATTDPSDAVRLKALRALGALAAGGRPVPLEPLIARLVDPAQEVRMAAVDALGQRDGDEAVDALLRALPGAGPEVRECIAAALAHASRDVLRRAMEDLATSDDLDQRLGLAWTLGKRGEPDGVPLLAAFLCDPEAKLRASAAGALGKIAAPEAVEALLGSAADPDPRTRAAVVNALGRQGAGTAGVAEALVERLRDPDAFVRNRAALALGRLGGPVAERALAGAGELVAPAALAVASALLGTDEGLAAATTALSEASLLRAIGELLRREEEPLRRAFLDRMRLESLDGAGGEGVDEDAIAAQYRRLLRTSQDARTRKVAAGALTKLGTAGSVETLADALALDPSEAVRLCAALALAERVDHAPARAALAGAVADPCAEVAVVAARALGRAGDRGCTDALFRRLGAGPPEVQAAVEASLAELHREAPAGFVDRMMGSARTEVTLAGVRVLERMGSPLVVGLLGALATSKDASVRAAAVRAAARLPLARVAALLAEAREDPHESVRLAALDALAAVAGDDAADRLAPLRLDPAVAVRRALAERLATLPAGPTGAGDELLAALANDLAPGVRAAALVSLLARGDEVALGRFVEGWSGATPEVQRHVREDPRAAAVTGQLTAALATSRSAAVREAAVVGLAALAAADLDARVLAALRDPVSAVRIAAVRALAPLDRPGLRQALAALLDDPDRAVREACG